MTMRYFHLLSCALLLFLFFACNSDRGDQKVVQDGETTAVKTVATETPKSDPPFPVYENFSDLEYLFRYQNDTTYVINFWATWCKPCVAELPYFEQLHAQIGDQKIKVVLVSLDFAKDVETKLVNFVQQRRLKPSVIALTDGKYNDWIDKVHPDWGGAIPVTYIYRAEQVLFHDQQYEDYEELIASVKKISG